jgi:glyoxylase-like metal-dependent hydrolase (beta-lactamase superfamily II)
MGIFTLEALQAQQGDCLLIRFGPDDDPRFLVVDGGPGTAVHDRVLGPRLRELREHWAPARPLSLPLVVCSHIDNDHIGGLIRLVELTAASDAVAVEVSAQTSARSTRYARSGRRHGGSGRSGRRSPATTTTRSRTSRASSSSPSTAGGRCS